MARREDKETKQMYMEQIKVAQASSNFPVHFFSRGVCVCVCVCVVGSCIGGFGASVAFVPVV